MGKLLPLLISFVGLFTGLGAGYALKPDVPPPGACEAGQAPAGTAAGGGGSPVAAAHGNPPAAAASAADCTSSTIVASVAPDGHGENAGATSEFAKLTNQFVVPVLEDGHMKSLVVLSISLEVAPGTKEQVYTMEPKLRDAFLKVMFRHANSGGFQGNFTERRAMLDLRGSLREAAAVLLGDRLVDVLILDIVRQDVG